MPTRSIKLGILPFVENDDIFLKAIRAVHQHRNKAVEHINKKRKKDRAVLRKSAAWRAAHQHVKHCEDRYRAIDAQIKEERAKSQKRSESAELITQRAEAKAARTAAYKARSAVARDIYKSSADEFQKIKESTTVAASKLNKGRDKNVHWGSANAVVRSVHQAHQSMPYLFDGTEEADVRFKAYNGSGALTFQIQTNARQQPIRMADLYGNELSNRRPISIAPVDPRAFDKSVPRGERKRLQRTTLTLKIRWDGEDYTVVCPLIMSYDISPNAVVTSIRVQKVKHANKEERHVILTVKDNPVDKAALDATGVLSLNFGWRKLDDGSLRVATGIDPADDLVLSPHLMSGLSLADGLQKIRDNNSNPIHDRLVEWKKLNASILSPWFREQTETLSLWEKQKRLAKLTLAWRQNRFDGDETMFEVMEAWRYDDHHLWNQQENHRRKVLRHRREIYRVYAARMARKYRNLVVDSTDFSGLARRADSVDEEHENKTARRNRQHAAVSTLRDALKSAFTARHGADAVHPAPLTLKFKDDEVA